MIETLERSHINIDALEKMTFGIIVLEETCRETVGLASYPEWISKHYDIHLLLAL